MMHLIEKKWEQKMECHHCPDGRLKTSEYKMCYETKINYMNDK